MLVPILILTLVAGFRDYSVGTDTSMYVEIFDKYLTRGLGLVPREHLFYACGVLILAITHHFSAVLLFFALVTYSLILLRFWDFRENLDLGWAVSLFTLFYFGGTMNVMRQYVAVAIVFFATRYLKQKRYWPFLVLVALASGFHVSAVLALLLPAFYIGRTAHTRMEKLYLCLLKYLSVPAMLAVLYLYRGYFKDFTGIHIGLMSLMKMVLMVASYVVARNAMTVLPEPDNGKSDHRIGVYQECSCLQLVYQIALLGTALGLTTAILPLASRVSYFFRIFDLVFYSMIFYRSQIGKPVKVCLAVSLILLGIYSLATYADIVPYGLFFA